MDVGCVCTYCSHWSGRGPKCACLSVWTHPDTHPTARGVQQLLQHHHSVCLLAAQAEAAEGGRLRRRGGGGGGPAIGGSAARMRPSSALQVSVFTSCVCLPPLELLDRVAQGVEAVGMALAHSGLQRGRAEEGGGREGSGGVGGRRRGERPIRRDAVAVSGMMQARITWSHVSAVFVKMPSRCRQRFPGCELLGSHHWSDTSHKRYKDRDTPSPQLLQDLRGQACSRPGCYCDRQSGPPLHKLKSTSPWDMLTADQTQPP